MSVRRLLGCLPLLVWLVVAALSLPLAGRANEQLLVLRVRASSDAELFRLARSGLDLLEQRDGDDRFVLADRPTLERLRAEGWDARVDQDQTALLAAQAGPSAQQALGGYRTVEQSQALMAELAAAYPTLATLVDYGDSLRKSQGQGGYDLLALRLTSASVPGPKPIFFLLSNIHAREIVTDEIALRFVRYLLEGYGRDAQTTYLLDEHEIVVAPLANPDGRQLVDAQLNSYQRKNLRQTGACAANIVNQIGVDLNRNSSFRWGSVDSPSQGGCTATYPGPSAASEPEVRALEDFIRSLFADRRGPGDFDAAPADTSGILITLHSYSELVLWPWGARASGPAPNAAALERLGQRLAAFNGYTAFQAYNLYDTSGTTDDWAYGELGLAAYTFEIGPAAGNCGGFLPPYSCLDSASGGGFWPRNLPALRYAASVARAPYLLPAGPDAGSLSPQSADGLSLTVALTGTATIGAAEAYLTLPPWRGGQPIALRPADGSFDNAAEQALLDLPPAEDSLRRLVLVRARDAQGNWGPLSASFVDVPVDLPLRSMLPLVILAR
jgi:hypothetical protein